MNQLKGLNKSGLSFVQQKRSDDKKDRGEVSTHSRIFGSDRIESVAEVLEDKVNDEDGRKVSIPGGIPLGINSVSSGSPPPPPPKFNRRKHKASGSAARRKRGPRRENREYEGSRE